MNLHEINKPLGELDDETAAELFLHWRRGGKIELKDGTVVHMPGWNARTIYRAHAERPSIDWSHVSEEYNFLARDEDGCAYLYADRPTIGSVVWYCDERCIQPRGFSSYKPGTCDWKDSLVCRPL